MNKFSAGVFCFFTCSYFFSVVFKLALLVFLTAKRNSPSAAASRGRDEPKGKKIINSVYHHIDFYPINYDSG